MNFDVVVIGAGLSGLMAATKGAEKKSVYLISQGQGAVNLTTGCVDILGYLPWQQNVALSDVSEHLQKLITKVPDHPYAKIGEVAVEESVAYFKNLTRLMGYPFQGTWSKNYLLPTRFGTIRPSALVPGTMADGDIRSDVDTLVIGFKGLLDFQPKLVADNINATRRQLGLKGIWSSQVLDLDVQIEKDLTPMVLAHWLEDENNFDRFVGQLKVALPDGSVRVALPAVLGSDYRHDLFARLKRQLGVPVFEIPAGQPTVSGSRLYNVVKDFAKKSGVRMQFGLRVLSAGSKDGKWNVLVDSAGHNTVVTCNDLVLATGGVFGKGLTTTRDSIYESLMDLPTMQEKDLLAEKRAFMVRVNEPYALSGVAVQGDLHPSAITNTSIDAGHLYIVGSNLPGYDPSIEKDGLGVALATGFAAGKAIG